MHAARHSNAIELGDYTWFYGKFADGRLVLVDSLCIVKTKNLALGATLTNDSPFEETAAFLNEHEEAFLDYLGDSAKSQIAKLEFTTVSYASQLWPQMPDMRLYPSGPQFKKAMIITKR